MKKNILLLINGFGIEQQSSYNVYSEELMPNMDRLTRERLFVSLSSKDLDYKSGYRNFSIGITEPLSYSLLENNISTLEYKNNQVFKYIVSQVCNCKSKLHIFCYMDSERSLEQLSIYLNELLLYPDMKIIVHIILKGQSMSEYKMIDKSISRLNYEYKGKILIGLVTGIDNMHDVSPFREIIKSFVTEVGEKWIDISKKLNIFVQTKVPPYKARTFAVNEGFKLEENDQILFFNYSNEDLTNFDKELKMQKYRTIDYTNIKYYSLFPTKNDLQIPFMYNFAVSSTYLLESLKSINAKCVVYDSKDKCSFINYYLTGLRNSIDGDLKYVASDDGILYDSSRLLENIKTRSEELIILNYEIETCTTVEEIEQRLKKIDEVIGVLDSYIHENNMALFISSLYGMEKELLNAKRAVCYVNFSVRVPLVVDDYSYIKSKYSILEGSVYDLSNTILKNINIGYKGNSLIRKKGTLLSIFYKKKKEV